MKRALKISVINNTEIAGAVFAVFLNLHIASEFEIFTQRFTFGLFECLGAICGLRFAGYGMYDGVNF